MRVIIRSIPACAGEPTRRRSTIPSPRVYPRVCGGTRLYGYAQLLIMGLSPRVRGNLGLNDAGLALTGSIPACAGEPRCRGRGRRLGTVYPRVCGGTPARGVPNDRPIGLSPRVRGNLLGQRPCAPAPGSIPACAGEPVRCLAFRSQCRVYPRVCGGTVVLKVALWSGEGLSPRVRGNHAHAKGVVTVKGSIPACAGEPDCGRLGQVGDGVYPRVCGGTEVWEGDSYGTCGLSPRVRGNLLRPLRLRRHAGSIPACAGEPGIRGIRGRWFWVYPRVCGGTDAMAVTLTLEQGLSPRVRGNQAAKYCGRWARGSIPACAGEPQC